MKAIAQNHALNFQRRDAGRTGHSDLLLLTKIGHDLRQAYGNVADAEQPERLLALAAAIDAKRSDNRHDD